MENIRILVVDDHEVVRLGLSYLFQQYPGFSVVGKTATGKEALTFVERFRPDVVVLDVLLRNESGIDICREITARFPETRVVILTSYNNEDMLLQCIRAGATGYVLKDVGNEELIRAVRAAYQSESFLDPTATKRLLKHVRSAGREDTGDEVGRLTKQEIKILGLVAEGLTNREIAKEVYLSEKTVRNYVSNILSKLNLSNRTEAAAYAVRHNLVHRNLNGLD